MLQVPVFAPTPELPTDPAESLALGLTDPVQQAGALTEVAAAVVTAWRR